MKEARGISVNLSEKAGKDCAVLPGIRVNGPIYTASYYRSTFALLENETVLPEFDDDFEGFLRHFDDFESGGYLCLNGEIVLFCDDINGMVFSAGKVEDILQSVREYYAESNA